MWLSSMYGLSQLKMNQHVLAILEKCNNLNHLKQLQSFIIAQGHSKTQFYIFKLVRFCTLKIFNFYYARLLFDHLYSPNVYLYTAMITAYASHPDYHTSAFALYRLMLCKGKPTANQFVYPHVLKSAPEVLESYGTKMVHTQIFKSGFGQYPVVQTALVDSYSRTGSCIEIAKDLFDEMAERNVVSWTAMVSGYMRVGDVEKAVLLFEEMPNRDVPSWNAAIAGCTQNGFFPEAISLLRKMVIGGNKPNQVTVVCSLSACGNTGMFQLGKSIHGYVYRNGIAKDCLVGNALIDMYGKCGNLETARRIFEMSSKKNLTSWNSVINCFALHGQSEKAISIFEEMINGGAEDVRPDAITFISLLNACTHGGLVEKGRAYFELMTNIYNIEPRIDHYGCLIDLLGRAGKFDETLKVINGMKMEPDEVVWGSLLNGCKIHGRMDLAEFAVKKLVELEPNNGGYGAMLANLYVQLQRWDEVRKVRKKLKEQNAYKTPGCSWIEVDGQVHQFYSVDKTHSRTDEIYNILESMVGLY